MTATEHAARNGHGDRDEARRALHAVRSGLPGAAAVSALAGAVKRFAGGRVPAADLDERDPDYIRESLPRLWLLSSLWFRGEVRGLGNVPEEGPVLLVGNHSGGNLTPDTTVLTLAFSTYFGVERAFYQLAHNLVLAHPALSFLRKYGTVAASHENARNALRAGAAVLVYPGGDHEVHRPSWERHRVDFGGRDGFIRLAIERGRADRAGRRPPAARRRRSSSARGEHLARALRLDRLFRLKVLPVSLAIPWGLNVGDMLGHIPLPAKITVEVLPPIHLRAGVRPRARRRRGLRPPDAADAGHARRARRRAAVPGAGMRVVEQRRGPRAARARVGAGLRSGARAGLLRRRHPLGVARASRAAASGRATGC